MILKVRNIAKIKSADININGITVIAGENNTGKSTIGKVVFSVFNSTYNMEQKVKSDRIRKIIDLIYASIRELRFVDSSYNGDRTTVRAYTKLRVIKRSLVFELSKNLLELKDEQDIYIAVADFFERNRLMDSDGNVAEIINNVTKEIKYVIDIDDISVFSNIISRYFNQIFNYQINNLLEPDKKASAEIEIHNKHLKLDFTDEECIIDKIEYQTLHEAIYIDSPFLFDHMNDNRDFYESSYQDEYLLNKLVQEDSRQMNIFDEIIANDKLDEIIKMLKEVTPGSLKKNSDLDEYYIQYENVPLNIKNLSAGIKAFMIIRTLLEKNILKNKDILILDEPEIHLHPQWQLVYAELIVLLEKCLDLSIIITTHSPYFLDAVNTFAKHHGVSDKINFYLSDVEGKQAVFEDVTDNLEKIYEKLAKPFDQLDNIKYS